MGVVVPLDDLDLPLFQFAPTCKVGEDFPEVCFPVRFQFAPTCKVGDTSASWWIDRRVSIRAHV